jgi:hypothetical protein
MTSTYMNIAFLSALEDALATLGCSWQMEEPGKCLKCSCSGTLRAVRWGRRTGNLYLGRLRTTTLSLMVIASHTSSHSSLTTPSLRATLQPPRWNKEKKTLVEPQPIFSDIVLYLQGPFDIVGSLTKCPQASPTINTSMGSPLKITRKPSLARREMSTFPVTQIPKVVRARSSCGIRY